MWEEVDEGNVWQGVDGENVWQEANEENIWREADCGVAFIPDSRKRDDEFSPHLAEPPEFY